jgi:hypothetical protein
MLVPTRASRLALTDQRLSWEASVGHRLPWPSALAEISVEREERWSRVEDTAVAGARPSLSLRLVYEL